MVLEIHDSERLSESNDGRGVHMHGQWSFHGTPYQIPESQQKVASPDWDSDDSEATIAYGGETEEDTSTSSITSTCGEDASGPECVEEESDDDGDELEPVYYPVELGGKILGVKRLVC